MPQKQGRLRKEVVGFQQTWKVQLERKNPYSSQNLTLNIEDFCIEI
jgi:hypothetical protein